MSFSGPGNHAEWAAAIGTIIGLFLILLQINRARKTAKGEFLLHVDEMVRHHDRIHEQLLRYGKEWKPSQYDVHADAQIHAYIGLFERIKILIDEGSLDTGVVDRLYGYRVQNIVLNDYLFTLIQKEQARYCDFILLCKCIAKLGSRRKEPNQIFIESCEVLLEQASNNMVWHGDNWRDNYEINEDCSYN